MPLPFLSAATSEFLDYVRLCELTIAFGIDLNPGGAAAHAKLTSSTIEPKL